MGRSHDITALLRKEEDTRGELRDESGLPKALRLSRTGKLLGCLLIIVQDERCVELCEFSRRSHFLLPIFGLLYLLTVVCTRFCIAGRLGRPQNSPTILMIPAISLLYLSTAA